MPLAEDSQDIAHIGHLLIQFALCPNDPAGQPPTEALGFFVCAQCHHLFTRHAISANCIATSPCTPEGATQEDLEDTSTPVILADNDPDHVAWIELQAWWYAYTVARTQELQIEFQDP